MVSVLALSVTFGATSPKGRGLGITMHFAWTAKGSHFGGAGANAPERASRLSQSFHTAIRTFFVRARSSLCFLLFVSILALSVIFDDTSPKGRGF